ncbi:MAG: phage portal protein, partial [Carnobacterium sp.]
PKFSFGGKDEINVILYTNTQIYEFKETTLAAIKLIAEEGFPKVHNYKGVPLTEYTSDRFRQGAYEDVIPLIDLYDFAQSDTAN